MAYIAVVDDEADIREILELQLGRGNLKVKSYENGDVFMKSLSEQVPDVVLLDIMMDNMNGYEVLSQLRKKHPDVRVIFLSAKSQALDKVLGLDLGADDYITKPFQREELIARVKAHLRRKNSSDGSGSEAKIKQGTIYSYETLVFNSESKTLQINDKDLKITRTEYLLLKLLTSSPRKIFTRDEILESVWEDTVVSERTIDVHIRRLRKKLGNYEDIINTHPGFGYSIVGPKN